MIDNTLNIRCEFNEGCELEKIIENLTKIKNDMDEIHAKLKIVFNCEMILGTTTKEKE